MIIGGDDMYKSIRVTKELHQKIRLIAATKGVTMIEIVQEMLNAYEEAKK